MKIQIIITKSKQKLYDKYNNDNMKINLKINIRMQK